MTVERWARQLWDYHHVGHTVAPSDVILVLGSHDTRVAERGAQLYLEGVAPLVVFSGNLGSLTAGIWTRPEAEIFAEVAAGMGVPRDRMLTECRSTNTGENVSFCRELLAARGALPRRAIAVQKPYMERRTLATFQARWPELAVRVTSPQIAFEDYANAQITKDDVIHIMVGDFQRLLLYADRGWSARQEVPPQVMEAYRRLVASGYSNRLIREP
ncbi:MAG TPA: YdcF family protein [Vicinamibacteria bacterium]